jgi:hypothetical protein
MRHLFVPIFISVLVLLPPRLKLPDVAPSSRVTPPAGEIVTAPAVPSLQTVMAEPFGKLVVDSSGIVQV